MLSSPEESSRPVETNIDLNIQNIGGVEEGLQKRIEDVSLVKVLELQNEWSVTNPISFGLQLHSNETFGGERKDKPPYIWKKCYLVHNANQGEVYLRATLFKDHPKEAEGMLKHELEHIVTFKKLGLSSDEYFSDSFLAEAMAGYDGADERLVSYIRENNIDQIPDISGLKTYSDIKSLGGDTNEQLFIEQPGYLVAYSFGEYLKRNFHREKILEFFRLSVTNEEGDKKPMGRERAFEKVFGKDLNEEVEDWKESIIAKLQVENGSEL